MNHLRLGTLFVLLLGQSSVVNACPLCDSERAKEVRAGLLDQDLGTNLFAATLPFVVLAGVVGIVHFGPFRKTKGSAAHGRKS